MNILLWFLRLLYIVIYHLYNFRQFSQLSASGNFPSTFGGTQRMRKRALYLYFGNTLLIRKSGLVFSLVLFYFYRYCEFISQEFMQVSIQKKNVVKKKVTGIMRVSSSLFSMYLLTYIYTLIHHIVNCDTLSGDNRAHIYILRFIIL